MKRGLRFGILMLIIVVLSQFAFGFGISSPYWKENPLIMYPGQTKDVALSLQNLVGDQDLIILASIEEGSKIASIRDKKAEYLMPFGSKDVYVNVRGHVPEDLNIGQNVSIGVLIKETAAGKKEEMLRTVAGVKQFIPVIIKAESEVPKSKEESIFLLTSEQWDIVWIVLIVIIVLAILLEEKHLHNKKKKKK